MPERVLIVEDELSVAEAVAYSLGQEGFEVIVANEGRSALKAFEEGDPDLVVLDLMLPNISGWDLFAAFRRHRSEVPVIMLTARMEEADRVAGLEMGADDYVTKPFSMRELTARVRTVLRRGRLTEDNTRTVLEQSGVHLDPNKHELRVNDQLVNLSPKEFSLLAYLMRHSGRVHSRSSILQAVWGETYQDERTVDVHVRWLRMKIEADPASPQLLLTVRGVGYKFVEAS
jgi:two-component system, OmpR family, response regulator RegX3